MAEAITVSTDEWRIEFPSDWQHKSSKPGSDYFETADGTKGSYLSTWQRKDPDEPGLDALQSFRTAQIDSLREQMPDRTWEIVDQWQFDEAGVALAGDDCLDRANNYRVVCIVMTQFPWTVRVSLHDYDCSDYQSSVAYFQPIIDSLAVNADHSD